MNDLVTIDWGKLPTRRELQSQLNRINLSADAKLALYNLSEMTYRVGDKIVDIGRRILAFVMELVRKFPNITIAVLAAIVISALIGSVALLGPLLQALLGPLVVAAAVGFGTLAEMREGHLGLSVDWLTREIEALVK